MTIDAIVLAVSAAVFVGVGVQGLIVPRRIIEPLDAKLESVSLKSEVRANYGGMHLGVAALLCLAAIRPVSRPAGLALLLAFTGGLVVGRAVSWAVEGAPNRYLKVFFGLELVGAAAAAVLLLRG